MVDPMTVNYDLTSLTSSSVIDNPATVLSNWNVMMNGTGIFVLLGVIGLVLFFAARKFVDSDTEALSYSGFIITFAGLLLFLVDTGTGEKLLGWGYLVIIILITAIATYMNFVNRRI